MGQSNSMQDERVAVLCGTTAALFWRAVREGRIEKPAQEDLSFPFQGVTGYRDLAGIDLSSIGLQLTAQGALSTCTPIRIGPIQCERPYMTTVYQPTGIALPPGSLTPLDILSCSKNISHRSAAMRARILHRPPAAESFYRVDKRLYVISPELTFLHSCLLRRMLPNIELGLEWCGAYALSAPSCPPVRHAEPLCTAADIRSYLSATERCEGIGAARKAAMWLADGLASPREAEVYLMLVLPPQLGGFGLPIPQVNTPIPLKGTVAEQLTTDAYYVADLLYPDVHLIVEYDGEQDHERRSEDIQRDKERRSVLAAMGYSVIVITRKDLENEEHRYRKVSQIARILGVTLPVWQLVRELDKADNPQHALGRWLFNPQHDHLPFGFGYV